MPEPWEWTVYPASTDQPMVACGISSLEKVSRMSVEAVLAQVDDALFGVLSSPRGREEICRRTRKGGTKWGPLFPGWTRPRVSGER